MQLELAGKAALVTGGSRGIGRSIVTVLHTEGCRVAVNSRNGVELSAMTAEFPGTVACAGDVTRPADARRIVEEVIATLGCLDILICNVGSGVSVPPGGETYDEWQRVFALNLWSATNVIEAARDQLVKSSGVVVCISSICGVEVVSGAPVTYSAAKAALDAYVRGIARPLGKQGVRINAVAPGNIQFEGSVWARKLAENPADVGDMLERNVSLRQLGTPQDVADLVAYLASPRSRFATGGVWTIDGGQRRS
jgi:NAD(P)-dependent dehydrogenase (short-subunit alcohol dehydrogenase family)